MLCRCGRLKISAKKGSDTLLMFRFLGFGIKCIILYSNVTCNNSCLFFLMHKNVCGQFQNNSVVKYFHFFPDCVGVPSAITAAATQ